MTDFNKILDKAKELESKMKESQEKIKNISVTGISGGDSVKITLNGEGEIINLNISSDIEVISYVADASVDIDGVISISKNLDSDNTIDMEYYNADGSRAELCLNGVRCSAKFGYDNKYNLFTIYRTRMGFS